MRFVEKNMLDLFKQFCDAYGIKNPNTGDNHLVSVFFSWLESEKKNNDGFYLDQLDELGVDYKTKNTIEVGKNAVDSLVLPYETIIAPKSEEGLEGYKDRTIIANLKFHGNLPFLIQKGVHVDHSIPCDKYKTFMTQNPYSFDEIAEWNKLPQGYHDLVVGVYGDINDHDKIVKRNMMYQFIEKIDPHYSPELYEVETLDSYSTIVRASSKTR